MSILIKDMEIPKNCVECKLSDHISPTECPIYSIEKGDYWDKRYKYCPLVEVPTPHGRLIDADAFDERVRVAGGMSEEELTEDFKDGVQTVLYMLSKQPTIIEAEGSEDGD